MIIDSSALIAILRAESDAAVFAQAIEDAEARRVSAANFVETAAVIDRAGGPIASRRLDDLLKTAEIMIAPVTEGQARIAREAYRDFGRGSGHAANLNFGDCFAYALARESGHPLLFKGEDFGHTDVTLALR
ncbi:type II toxin-antitoxin system VapC family toxin [soil metagenome]